MRNWFVFLVILSSSGCKPEKLSPDMLLDFVADESNGLRKSVALGNSKVEVFYRPSDLLAHQELGDTKAAPEEIQTLRKKYGPHLYFILKLSSQDKEALHQVQPEGYSNLLQVLSFDMNRYVTLTTSTQDTIVVGDFMLNRTFGMSNSTDVLFVFDRAKAKDKDWIQFNLNEFGLGVGNQRFRFDMCDIEQAPGIDFRGQ